MTEEIIIAGFGGQGVLFLGETIARIGMILGKNVSWLPSYGPEMRGGTANCSVIISDDEIASPVVFKPSTFFALNRPSFEKFENFVEKNGIILMNTSLIDLQGKRDDVIYISVDATNIASSLGNIKATNMVMLGAYIKYKKLFDLYQVLDFISKNSKSKEFFEINKRAVEYGYNSI
ncbi:2-oxoacid:acceptor oxidoreductase family protein [Caldicellulosiruptoraceae bacterium PP1]